MRKPITSAMNPPEQNNRATPIAIWLFVGVGMLIVQILLGGITRLSGSGLSITEWNLITGAIPPLNEREWIAEFTKYQQSPQFRLINFDFTLRDFKFIFFWEWLHRFWARMMGFVFLIPFVIFLIQRRFKKEMIKPLLILFLLGALQGAVGWIMVASGLTGDAIYVKPAKLALHFIFALGLLAYTFWFALMLGIRKDQFLINTTLRKWIVCLIVLLLIQLVYGALMAGHKAATAAPTWPDINGSLIPPHLLAAPDGMLNLIENKITIHFIHRTLGYFIFILLTIFTVKLHKAPLTSTLVQIRKLPLILALIQVFLGILSVVTSTAIVPNQWGIFEWMAQLHQLVAMLLLLSLISVLYLLHRSKQATSN